MNYSTNTFKTKDKEIIFYYKWSVKKESLQGIVQISHGIGEHAGRYQHIAKVLQKQGYEVYANDHRIHGKSVKNKEDLGYYDGPNFFKDALNDMRQLSEIIKKEHPTKKIILFGHSMGSLLSRDYVTKYSKDIQALVLSGTASFMKGLGTFGLYCANVIGVFKGRQQSSSLLKSVFFTEFNKKFKPNRTKVDWISSDENQVDIFEADPYRIEDFSVSVFADVLKGSKKVNAKSAFKKTPKTLPIYIFSGDQDPVGEMGEGVTKVAENYKNAGCKNLTLKLYKGGRHEMLNEKNRDQVQQHLIYWLKEKLENQN